MTQQGMLTELEAAAAAMAVKVSYEALASSVGGGGLCRVRGQYRIIVDKRSQVGERVATLAQAFGQLDTSAIELSPTVRELVRHYTLRRAS